MKEPMMFIFSSQRRTHPSSGFADDAEGFQWRGKMAPFNDGSTSRQFLDFRFPRIYVGTVFWSHSRCIDELAIIEDFVAAGFDILFSIRIRH